MKPSRIKSRTFRRKDVKLPSGTHVTHYKKRKPKVAHCSQCGAALLGTPRGRPLDIRKMTISQRTPERPFGGDLCSKCLRKTMREKAYKLKF